MSDAPLDPSTLTLTVTCPKGLEALLADELTQFGWQAVRQSVGSVRGQGSLDDAYRAVLWSRLANRVLLTLARAPVSDADSLRALVQQVDWREHLSSEGSLAVDVSGTTPQLRHTRNTALQVKDGIVDQFRDNGLARPSVDLQQPDIRLHLRLHRHEGVLSLDLGGQSLHQRGYRLEGARAPLKENLAAALLIRAGWPERAAAGEPLFDPMCGSGTLLAEAGLMAADMAPGLLRESHGLERWLGHVPQLWQALCDEAEQRAKAGLAKGLPALIGRDLSDEALSAARGNLARAGLDTFVTLEHGDARHLPIAPAETGLVITNPPYGERLSEIPPLVTLYAQLGQQLREHYGQWRLALFTSNPDLAHRIPASPARQYALFNGPIACKLFLFDLAQQRERYVVADEAGVESSASAEHASEKTATSILSEGTQMLANRLRKNRKKLAKWIKRESIECYRLYDADMPEYAMAIDIYGHQVHVQEYAPPRSIDPDKAQQRLMEALQAIPEVLDVAPEDIHLKQRRRQSGTAQYNRFDQKGRFFAVREGQAQLMVNLTDYLDTGLFLDHRPTRLRIYELAQGKRFLNLFCYTGAATIQAALGGARATTSVDLSKTYLGWLERNLKANQLDFRQHLRLQADCLQWIKRHQGRYDLIFMDPPTFSNSKKMEGVLDVQRDHVELIDGAMKLLSSDGLLIFSNNQRRFQLDADLMARYEVKNVTSQSIPPDFARNQKIHQCFEFRHRIMD